MAIIDNAGNHHHGKGTPDGGKFATKSNNAPTSVLEEPANPLARRFDTLDEKITAMQAEIETAVDSLRDDEQWRRHLDMMSTFHTYSFSNQMLIAIQRPDATHVAGFQAWKKLGKPVNKGEKGISILAPKVVKKRDKNGDEILDDNGKPQKVVVGFTSATVFDVAQTGGDPLPDVDTSMNLSEDPPEGYTDDLEDAIRSQGYEVRYEKIPGGAYGYTRSSNGTKVVVIDEDSTVGTRATTLAHELGHIMCGHMEEDRKGEYHTGHGGKRGSMEVEAESFAYTLSRINGMQTHIEPASKYIAGWETQEPESLQKIGDTLAKAVKTTMKSNAWRNAVD